MANSTITDALTNIFKALGGDVSKLKDNHDAVDYLNDLGDALVAAVGGDKYFDIIYTCPEDGTPSINKTGEEILAAYNEGKIIRLKIPIGNYISYYQASYDVYLLLNSVDFYKDESDTYFGFGFYSYYVYGLNSDNINYVAVYVDNSDNITASTSQTG